MGIYYNYCFVGRVVHVDGSYAAVKFPSISKDVSGIFPKDKDPTVPANDDVTNLIKILDQQEVRLMKKDDLQVSITTNQLTIINLISNIHINI